MNTKSLEKFEVLNSEMLASVEGGFGWGNFFGSVLGTLDGGGPTLDQLNGGATRNFRACSCSPSGTGGTPNSCNFC